MARVLLVDDEPSILTAFSRILSSHCELVTASTAAEAAGCLDHGVFDVVITDFDMPGHNGAWLLYRVAERQPGALRVLMSGDEPRDLAAHVATGLVQKWLPKPFAHGELLACLGMTQMQS
jgi:DNA-binding NtrC family response regulator